ncbi:MAG TPA: glutathione binding-like protein [Stellaceae bacterium]|nr:glutathione binding-like protein [Stellaceae bacterium]
MATKEQAGRPRVDDAIKVGLYLASDTYSLADVAVIPYILRLELLRLSPIWDGRRNVAAWWERVRQRSSTDTGDLQTDDGGGRRAVQESSARPMARGARDVARRCIADPLSLIDSPEHLLNQAGAALLIRRSSKSSVSKIG